MQNENYHHPPKPTNLVNGSATATASGNISASATSATIPTATATASATATSISTATASAIVSVSYHFPEAVFNTDSSDSSFPKVFTASKEATLDQNTPSKPGFELPHAHNPDTHTATGQNTPSISSFKLPQTLDLAENILELCKDYSTPVSTTQDTNVPSSQFQNYYNSQLTIGAMSHDTNIPSSQFQNYYKG